MVKSYGWDVFWVASVGGYYHVTLVGGQMMDSGVAMGLSLARIFADGMVLQHGVRANVWGTGEPGMQVEACVQGKRAATFCGQDGSWHATIVDLEPSEEETLVVSAGDERIEVRDVAVGEVFVAAGQSNMEFWMRYDRDVEQFRPRCENPRIRFYDVPKCSYPGQIEDFDYSKVGIWRKATPEDLDYFSAVGYYFARRMELALGMPIGVVGCNYGGTASSAWMRPDHAAEVQPEQAASFAAKLGGVPYEELLAYGRLNPRNDKGYATWPAWNEFFLPRTPTPQEIARFAAKEVQVDGVPASVGGLDISAGGEDVPPSEQLGMMTPTKEAPGALFRHMVVPIAGFSARGVLWYQGESDDELDGTQWRYERALRTIVDDWRETWRDQGLPFLVVQLPGFGSWVDIEPHDYVTIRGCQQRVADTTDSVWLCSIGDVGDEHDIHPKVKRPVGERLALLALRHLFGHDVLADAPRCVCAEQVGSRMTLRFDNAGEELVLDGDAVAALEVRCDGEPMGLSVRVNGDCLLLDLEEVPTGQVTVRFAQSNWYRINLFNEAHVPALPFVIDC